MTEDVLTAQRAEAAVAAHAQSALREADIQAAVRSYRDLGQSCQAFVIVLDVASLHLTRDELGELTLRLLNLVLPRETT